MTDNPQTSAAFVHPNFYTFGTGKDAQVGFASIATTGWGPKRPLFHPALLWASGWSLGLATGAALAVGSPGHDYFPAICLLIASAGFLLAAWGFARV